MAIAAIIFNRTWSNINIKWRLLTSTSIDHNDVDIRRYHWKLTFDVDNWNLTFLLSWLQLRSSFTKAFSRNAKITKTQSQSEAETEQQQSPPPPPTATDTGAEVAELQKQLREKDLVLTDIRLEALSSAHQLESLKDTVMKMRVRNHDPSPLLTIVQKLTLLYYYRAKC